MFGKTENGSMKRLVDDVDEDEVHTSEGSKKKIFKSDKPTDVLTKVSFCLSFKFIDSYFLSLLICSLQCGTAL